MSEAAAQIYPAADIRDLVARLFEATGVVRAAAQSVAEGLVEADLCGVPSHGLMLTDMYVARIRAGSVGTGDGGTVLSDRGIAMVVDAGHCLGHLTGDRAMELAVGRARQQGAGIVAVRHGFHFGMARRYAEAAARQSCIGIAMCNTRPLMPAPGGAERVVGNNPISIAVPAGDDAPIVLDMATSEAAMGKIRLAAKAGEPIPPTWAVKEDGSPTTDAEEAISGMLLPSAGPKGFGLALVIDLMCGLLSGGAFGPAVKPLYGDMAEPYDCSHLFMAIDLAYFGDPQTLQSLAAGAAARVRLGSRAPGVERLYAPGEPEWRRRQQAAGRLALPPSVANMLADLARTLNVSPSPLPDTTALSQKDPTSHAQAGNQVTDAEDAAG